MFQLQSPKQNQILAALPPEDYERLLPHLELSHLSVGQSVYEAGASIHHLYFPTTSILAPVYGTESGTSVRLALIGNEGLVGISVLLGGGGMPGEVVVQSAGNAYHIRPDILIREFDACGKFQQQVLRYTQALITQTAQNAVCNRHHNVEQQLSRFLLMSLDRLSGNTLQMTHEHIAVMLGVRRESVTQAALKLQSIGAIRYSRGHIAVLDRDELEDLVCECYSVVNDEYERLLPCRASTHRAPVAITRGNSQGGTQQARLRAVS